MKKIRLIFLSAAIMFTASIVQAQETATSITFRLSAADEPVTLIGDVRGGSENFSNIKTTGYSAIKDGGTTWPDGPEGIDPNHIMQCLRPEGDGKTWIDTRDDNTYDPTQYVEFQVNSALGKYFLIEKFSCYFGLSGGSGLGCAIYGSNKADFSNPVLLYEKNAITANQGNVAMADPNVCISWKSPYIVRVYPYLNNKASKIDSQKFFISDITFTGKGSDTEFNTDDSAGIDEITDDDIISVEYYTIDGVRHDHPVNGLNIVRSTTADGKTSVSKLIL